MDIPLDITAHFDGISSGADGAAVDADSTPTFAVYEEATDTDIGVGGNMTKRTSLTGNYRGSFTVSAANGFEVGKWYNVIGSATIAAKACKGILKAFRVILAESIVGEPKVDVGAIGGDAQSATDIKDFADAGYDPGTNKVQGVVLTDTVTTLTNLPAITANWLTAAGIATDAAEEIRNAITGGAYALSTDANGRVRIVDGTNAGEIATTGGAIDTVLSVTDRVTSNIDQVDGVSLATHVAGYFPGDTRRWNGTAPANLSASGYVHSVLMRWLTDDAAGTLLALVGGRVPSDEDGYIDDFVYLDPTNGTAGTVVGVNGTIRNSVDTWADAYTIAVARGIQKIKVSTGNAGLTITLPAGSFDGCTIDVNGANLAIDSTITTLGTFSSVYSSIPGGGLSPTGSLGSPLSDGSYYKGLRVGGNCRTTGYLYMEDCYFLTGTILLTAATSQTVQLVNCYNASYNAMTLDMGGNGLSSNKFLLLNFGGDVTVTNMRSSQRVEYYGYGKLAIASSCTGGIVKHTSHVEVTDSSGGAVTVDLVSDATGDDATLAAIDALPTAAEIWANGTRSLTELGFDLAAGDFAADWLTAAGLATDATQEIRNAITGGAYALSTDANGRVRIVDGTGAGELDTTSGGVLVASLATQAKADVNAEVLDCLFTDTYAEPGQGTPAATASIITKLNYLYKGLVNKKEQTASQLSLYNAAGNVVDQKSLTSDNGATFTSGVWTTGA